MNFLHTEAERLSGVSKESAHLLLRLNLIDCIAPSVAEACEVIKRLSTSFYERVYADEADATFRGLFSNVTKEEAVRNQYEFLVELIGGPKLYSARKGHPALLGRHAPYNVTREAGERWLFHMRAALESMRDEVGEDIVEVMWAYFRHTAYYVSCGRELMNSSRLVGYSSGPGGYHQGGR